MALMMFLQKVRANCNVLYNFASVMENRSSVILEGLNSEQKAAVSCVDGPVLIVAGAGSGKTRVLTSRIAYILAEKNLDPARILALTFTKKAASEMKERIALMVGERRARRLYMGTFHSVFIRFLREFAESLGYPSTFTIYDTSDSVSAIKACLKELQLDDKVYKPKDVLSRISMAKNNLVTAEAYARNNTAIQNDTVSKKPFIWKIFLMYAEKCRKAGVMDFDDILLNMNILLRDNAEAMQSISERFRYIMVDEYQDTNKAQYMILRRLAQGHENLCVVGDDSQSIYAFRGAKIENILNFKKDYPSHNIFRLEQNYRSTKVIVEAANSLIARNTARIPKECYSMGEEGEKIRLIQAYTEQEEAYLIASSIVSRIHSSHAEYQDFAILYRTNAQSRALEEALRRRNLPYMIYSGNSFFERAEVKDMMAYFKLVANLNDDESFKRIVNKPARGIGDTSLSALSAAASNHKTSLFKAAYLDDLETFGLKQAAIKKIREFCDMVARLCLRSNKEDAYTVAAAAAMDSGLLMFYKSDTSIEGQSRTANVEELLNSIKIFIEEKHNEYMEEMQAEGMVGVGVELTASDLPVVTLGDYLENASLLSAVDISDEESSNKIALMTVHSSKGLEFPVVILGGISKKFNQQDSAQKVIFHADYGISMDVVNIKLRTKKNSLKKQIMQRMLRIENMEEEARVLYVAMTRAIDKLIMVGAFPSLDTKEKKWSDDSDATFLSLTSAGCFADWIMPFAGGRGFKVVKINPEDIVFEEKERLLTDGARESFLRNKDKNEVVDADIRRLIEERFLYSYKQELSIGVHAAVSVSELKKLSYVCEDEDRSFLIEENEAVVPKFIADNVQEETSGETGTSGHSDNESKRLGMAVGTAYHTVMEHYDFANTPDKNAVETLCKRLVLEGKIEAGAAKKMRIDTLLRFAGTKLYARMQSAELAGTLKKEQPFVIGMDSGEVRDDWPSGELIMVQGIIDAFFEEGGELVLVDYKTDRVPEGEEPYKIFSKRYGKQMELYARALEQLTGKEVKEKIIYALGVGKEFLM